MLKTSKISLWACAFLLFVFFIVKTSVLFETVESSRITRIVEYFCFIAFIPLFWILMRDLRIRTKDTVFMNEYSKKLNTSLINQSHNELFYVGNTRDGAKSLTREITEAMEVDRASIWLYNKERDSIVCQQLYIRPENSFHDGTQIFEKDFFEYFEALRNNPIVVADNAETHPSTKCFKDLYLKPLGIKSMLDVPIWYKGSNIGVICIENLTQRKWRKIEVNFAQMLSALYAFAFSMQETNDLLRRIQESENFIDKSSLISITDNKGRITYVNEKFTKVSGYTLDEVLGKDHSIVNSGLQPEGYWGKMYETVLKGNVWNDVVANKAKDGSLYYVDTYIRARFDANGVLEGFSSIRQDVTEMVKTNDQLNNIVASQTAYVLRTDMEGKHTYWNKKFEDEFGWVYEGNMMHGDSLLSICESHHGAAYNAVMECVASPGKIIKVELDKPHRDGSRRTTLWEFVCLVDGIGQPTEVQCMGIDITDRVKAEKKMAELLKEVERKETDFRYRMNAINQSNMVIEFDCQGVVKFANENFCYMMGYTKEEIIGKHHTIFIYETQLDSSEYSQFWKKLNSGEFTSSVFRRKKKNGEEVWIQATYNPILDNSGKVTSIMKIATDVTDRINQSLEIDKKNTYLEHAAKILRHDMHSGINTYIPRGVSSLERRLKEEDIKNLKIEAPLKMIKEGLKHSQKVYKGVYEFTNLVKKDVVLNREDCNLKEILLDYLSSTAYISQVLISDLPTISVNEALFCTAVDNLIRNGLKYNDSETKFVKIYFEKDTLYIQDNGRGITQEDFIHLSKPYTRKEGQKESGTGLGLNICVAILHEHGFSITCEKNEIGTKMKIKIA